MFRANLAVSAAGTGADEVGPEPFAIMAHPTDAPCRHAGHHGESRHVVGHHRARGDEGMLAQGMTADNRGVGADRRSALDQCGTELVLALDLSARIVDIGEDAGRAAEDPVLEGDALVDRDIILDPAAREDVDEVPNVGTRSNLAWFIDISRFMDLHVRVGATLLCSRRSGLPS